MKYFDCISKFRWAILFCLMAQLILINCGGGNREEKIVSLFYESKLDSFARFLTTPIPPELDFVLKRKLSLEHSYTLKFIGDRLLARPKELPDAKTDTIICKYDPQVGKIKLDTGALFSLFSFEKKIRLRLSAFNDSIGNYQRALKWLIYGERIGTDELYGSIFYKMNEFATAFPYLERSYKEGSDNAGLLLAYVYSFDDRGKAITLLKDLAKRNNSDAMVKLGDYYETYFAEFGYTPPTDAKPTDSFNWYKKAADLQNSLAMNKLGFIYQNEINKKQNLDSAYYWFKKSSDLGESSSSIDIANLYFEGEYFEENLDSGLWWMKKAIKQDPQTGYFALARIYERGIVVDQNLPLALKYFLKSDSLGDNLAKAKVKDLRARYPDHRSK